MKNIILCVALLFAIKATAQFRIVGYLKSWEDFPGNASTVNFSKLTHLNIAFANPDAHGKLPSIEGLSTVVNIAHAKNVKVLISVGGADLEGTQPNWQKLTMPDSVLCFCNKILHYINANNFDGVDVDLEGKIIGNNYGNFIYTLSSVLKPKHKLITAALANWFADQVPDSCLKYFDFVNLMCYDFTGPWDTAHPGQHAPFSMVLNSMQIWSAKGLTADKTVIGVPFYGHGFYKQLTSNDIDFKKIVSKYPGAENSDQAADTIYYNGFQSIIKKTNYALQNASGIMMWELSEDAPGDKSLLNLIYKTAHKQQ